ncbi:carbon-nitrogen family hydrolase [Nocardia sp. NPDC049220]|uniref:carbon-nitrogen family hydrolase n=1 Tax=Nocardia sp. NPDC049220 TaxID=3155273 RepID=UPI0033FD0EBC
MKIALVQIASPAAEPVAERRDRVDDLVRSAGDADLIVLPELWAAGYFAFDDYDREAEPTTGPTVSRLAELARETESYVHVGSFVERLASGALRNTAALLDPRGSVVHSYSKIHVFGYRSKEAQLLAAGESVTATRAPFGVVAATTCYDLRFPELWRCLVDAGAQVVIVPAAWPAARLAHWQLFTSVRAVEEQVLLIACNATGTQAGVELAGHSRVVDPWGTVLAEAGTHEGITWCEADPGVVPAVRDEFPVLGDRLPSYSGLIETHEV